MLRNQGNIYLREIKNVLSMQIPILGCENYKEISQFDGNFLQLYKVNLGFVFYNTQFSKLYPKEVSQHTQKTHEKNFNIVDNMSETHLPS